MHKFLFYMANRFHVKKTIFKAFKRCVSLYTYIFFYFFFLTTPKILKFKILNPPPKKMGCMILSEPLDPPLGLTITKDFQGLSSIFGEPSSIFKNGVSVSCLVPRYVSVVVRQSGTFRSNSVCNFDRSLPVK